MKSPEAGIVQQNNLPFFEFCFFSFFFRLFFRLFKEGKGLACLKGGISPFSFVCKEVILFFQNPHFS